MDRPIRLGCDRRPQPFAEGFARRLCQRDDVGGRRACAAQEWAPLSAPVARRDHPRDLDGVARLRRFARAYGVDPDRTTQLVDLIFAERQQALANIRSEIAAGNHSWVDYWRESRGEERAQADDAWLEQHRDALVDAIGGRS